MLCKAAQRDAILLTMDLQNDWKRSVLLRSCSKLGQRIRVIRGNSQEQKTFERVIREFGSRELDLLFIDGDHSLAGATRDFELYSKLVRPGGVIALHDILPTTEHDMVRGERFTATGPLPFGIFRGSVP
jgi:predicted O-methyltransferase YrrM